MAREDPELACPAVNRAMQHKRPPGTCPPAWSEDDGDFARSQPQPSDLRIAHYELTQLGHYTLTVTPTDRVPRYTAAMDEPTIDGVTLGVRLDVPGASSAEGNAVYAITHIERILYIGISKNKAIGDRLGWYQSRAFAKRRRSFLVDGDTRNRVFLIETLLGHYIKSGAAVPADVWIHRPVWDGAPDVERRIENQIKHLAAWNHTKPAVEIPACVARLGVLMKANAGVIRTLSA